MITDELPIVYGPAPQGTETIAIDQDAPELPAASDLPASTAKPVQ